MFGQKIVNRLPSEITRLDSKTYSTVLKSWLVGAAYYYFEEWFDDDLDSLGKGILSHSHAALRFKLFDKLYIFKKNCFNGLLTQNIHRTGY